MLWYFSFPRHSFHDSFSIRRCEDIQPLIAEAQRVTEEWGIISMAKSKGISLNENSRLVMQKPLLFAKLRNYKREDYTANAKNEW